MNWDTIFLAMVFILLPLALIIGLLALILHLGRLRRQREEQKTTVMHLAEMEKTQRGWGWLLIIFNIGGVIVAAVGNPGNAEFPSVLGIALPILVVAIMFLSLRDASMFLVYGILLIIVGIVEAVSAGLLGLGFAAIRLVWGISFIRQYLKYRRYQEAYWAEHGDTLYSTYRQTSVGRMLNNTMGWTGLISAAGFGLAFIVGILSALSGAWVNGQPPSLLVFADGFLISLAMVTAALLITALWERFSISVLGAIGGTLGVGVVLVAILLNAVTQIGENLSGSQTLELPSLPAVAQRDTPTPRMSYEDEMGTYNAFQALPFEDRVATRRANNLTENPPATQPPRYTLTPRPTRTPQPPTPTATPTPTRGPTQRPTSNRPTTLTYTPRPTSTATPTVTPVPTGLFTHTPTWSPVISGTTGVSGNLSVNLFRNVLYHDHKQTAEIDGNRMVVAHQPSTTVPPTLHVYRRANAQAQWTREAVLTPPEGIWEYGISMELTGDVLVVEGYNQSIQLTLMVYLFQNGEWRFAGFIQRHSRDHVGDIDIYNNVITVIEARDQGIHFTEIRPDGTLNQLPLARSIGFVAGIDQGMIVMAEQTATQPPTRLLVLRPNVAQNTLETIGSLPVEQGAYVTRISVRDRTILVDYARSALYLYHDTDATTRDWATYHQQVIAMSQPPDATALPLAFTAQGDTAIIGQGFTTTARYSGNVYVYHFDPTNNWSLVQHVTPSYLAPSFGRWIHLQDTTLAVTGLDGTDQDGVVNGELRGVVWLYQLP